MKQLRNLLSPLLAVFFLLTVWFVFSKPYFINTLVPIPTRQLVAFFPPWHSYSEYAGPVKNNAMPDVLTQLYPWKHFSIEQLKSGHIPFWNPNNFSGNPHIANYQTAIFSPFTLLYFVLPFVDAWSLTILVQPLLAGLGMYLFMRQLKKTKLGSVIGSISFMFCGFMVVWMEYGTLSMSIACLPWALYALDRYFLQKDTKSLLLLSLSLILSFFSGHFQTSLYLLIFVICYLVYQVMGKKDYRLGIKPMLAIIMGLIITSVQILPTLLFYNESFRSQSIVKDQAIPLFYYVTLFAPDIFGSPVTRNDWIGFYAERAGFIGIVPFVLAWFSVFQTKKRPVLFFIGAAVVSFLFSLDWPLQELLRLTHIPIIATSNPTRIIVLLSFSLSVLAVFGYEAVLEYLKKKELKKIVVGLIPSLVICLLTVLFVLIIPLIPHDKAAIAIRNMVLPAVFFTAILGVGVVAWIRPHKNILLGFGLIVLLLVSIDSLRFATKWTPFDSRALLYPDNPVITAMQRLEGDGRVFGAFGPEVQNYFNIKSIEGYDPLYIQRYAEFINAAQSGKYRLPDRSFVSLDKRSTYADRVLDLLSVTLFFQPKSHVDQPWAYPIGEKGEMFTKVYEDPYYLLYKNNKALPRFVLYRDYRVIPDKVTRLATFYAKDFTYETTLLLEKEPKNMSSGATGSGSIRMIASSATEITLEVESTTSALLFSSEPYYPSWKASIDGKEAEILIADHAFRAVVVPPGKSIVKFWYDYLAGF